MDEQTTQQEQIMKNMQIMNEIVRSMKEIPELPSEAPKDVSVLERVEFPEGGGILTTMSGHPYPYKGFPFFEFVDKIDFIKKVTRNALSGIYHQLKNRNKLLFITLIPAFWVLKPLLRTFIYVFYRMVERFRVKSNLYCASIRELHRAFSIEKEKESQNEKELRYMIRDLVCMILEFDNAYRYRLQDVVVEVNQSSVQKHTVSEIIRLFDIMSSRERTQEIKDTWTLFKLFIRFYLFFDREFNRILGDTLALVDLEKIRMDSNDRYYCLKRKDYLFKFFSSLTDEEREYQNK